MPEYLLCTHKSFAVLLYHSSKVTIDVEVLVAEEMGKQSCEMEFPLLAAEQE